MHEARTVVTFDGKHLSSGDSSGESRDDSLATTRKQKSNYTKSVASRSVQNGKSSRIETEVHKNLPLYIMLQIDMIFAATLIFTKSI